jgi:hypothetical protein
MGLFQRHPLRGVLGFLGGLIDADRFVVVADGAGEVVGPVVLGDEVVVVDVGGIERGTDGILSRAPDRSRGEPLLDIGIEGGRDAKMGPLQIAVKRIA